MKVIKGRDDIIKSELRAIKQSLQLPRLNGCLLDVLWGQPIKLIQVASASELHENQRNDLLFFKIVPCHCFGASEASKIDWLKN